MAEKQAELDKGAGKVSQHGKAKGDIGFFSEMLACITLVSQNDLDFYVRFSHSQSQHVSDG
jgi:hypothetical protein